MGLGYIFMHDASWESPHCRCDFEAAAEIKNQRNTQRGKGTRPHFEPVVLLARCKIDGVGDPSALFLNRIGLHG